MRQFASIAALRLGAAAAVGCLALGASACSLVLATNDSGNLAAGCASNADCTGRPGGDFHICMRGAGAAYGICVPLKSERCNKVAGDWSNDNAFIFGSILSENLSAGVACEDAITMAIDDFQSGQGLPPVSPGGPRRPLAYVGCSDDFQASTGEKAAHDLVDTVGVQAIIGAEWSGITIGLSGITAPKGVLLISPGATSIQITDLQDNHLVWRTSPSDVFQAATTVQYVSRVEQTLLATRPMGSKIRVAIAFKGDSYGRSISEAVLHDLRFNGAAASDAANSAYFKLRNYGDPSDASSQVSTAQTATELLDFQPDIAIVLGTEEGITAILAPVEMQWSTRHPGVAGPRWIMGDGGLQTALYDTVGKNDDLRRRVTGTVPGTSNALFQTFKQRYRSKNFNDGSDPEVFGAAGSYDSVYLLAYSAVTLGSKPLTGANLAGGFANLVPPAGTNPVDVGVNGILSTTTTLQGGGTIDLNGASGALNFDLVPGEAPSDIQIWCMPKDASGKAAGAQFSGLYLDAVSRTLEGAIGSICQF
jgi:ABC-type branched-subunit amino acid transport system substrate-binding protein